MKTLLLTLVLLTSALCPLNAALVPAQTGQFQGVYYPTHCTPGYTATSGQIRLNVEPSGAYAVAVDATYVIYGQLTPRGNFHGLTPTGIKFRGKIDQFGHVAGRYKGPRGTCKGLFSASPCPGCF